MKITKNSPPPIVQPPPTYDLTGISQEEMDMLRYFAAASRARFVAAPRFLNKTSQFEGNTYAPDKCFT